MSRPNAALFSGGIAVTAKAGLFHHLARSENGEERLAINHPDLGTGCQLTVLVQLLEKCPLEPIRLVIRRTSVDHRVFRVVAGRIQRLKIRIDPAYGVSR